MRQGESGDYVWFVVDGELEARLYAGGARVTGDAHPLGDYYTPSDLTSSVAVSAGASAAGSVDGPAIKGWAPPAGHGVALPSPRARWESGSGRRYDVLGVLRPGDYFGAPHRGTGGAAARARCCAARRLPPCTPRAQAGAPTLTAPPPP